MTKREFDKLTKQIWGARAMASSVREAYRRSRGRITTREADFICRRARERLRHLPTLAIGQKWRNVAEFRRYNRLPLTENLQTSYVHYSLLRLEMTAAQQSTQ